MLRVAALACLLCLPALALAQDQPATSPQVLFGGVILRDRATVPAVAELVRSGRAIVVARTFADLTGDGKSDAVVAVDDGGLAGAVALYVLSADGSSSGKLRAVFRSQSLYQARVHVSGVTLTVITPVFSRGDDPCCPRRELQRDYAWDAHARKLVRIAARTVVPAA